MEQKYIDIHSISDLHEYYGISKPKHPLISVIDLMDPQISRPKEPMLARTDFYTIFCKRFTGTLYYGKTKYDFNEGSLMFTAPHQVVLTSPDMQVLEGWGLFFYHDLFDASRYSFFNYDVNEALHVSEDEKATIWDCVEKIRKEYSQNIDQHTQQLIISNLELLLNYCQRFYDRQFLTRSRVSNDLVQQFERLLKNYTLEEEGLPNVQYFAAALHLSPGYLSDLLKKYTGKTTLEHIHLELVDKAKSLLWNTEKSVSEIAYELGFEHLSHFTKMFKAKTGVSPSVYRREDR
jgi:AraC family transcriptional regulator, transcriptional activator of pobA